MKITDLRIGDIVCNHRTKFPMRVVGIYEDGAVYLDFEGNEGDVFEEECKDLEFAEPRQNTGSTVLGNIETTFAGLAHILHSIAIEENKPKVAEALIASLDATWKKMKNDYNIDL